MRYNRSRGLEAHSYLASSPSEAERLLRAGCPLKHGMTPPLCAALNIWPFAPSPRLRGMLLILATESIPLGMDEPVASLDEMLDPDLEDDETREPADHDGDSRFTVYVRPDVPREYKQAGFDPALGTLGVALRAIWHLYVHDRWGVLTELAPDAPDPLFAPFVDGPIQTLGYLPLEESEPFLIEGRVRVWRTEGEEYALTPAAAVRQELDGFSETLGWWREQANRHARDPTDSDLKRLAETSPAVCRAADSLLDRYWSQTHPNGEKRRRRWLF